MAQDRPEAVLPPSLENILDGDVSTMALNVALCLPAVIGIQIEKLLEVFEAEIRPFRQTRAGGLGSRQDQLAGQRQVLFRPVVSRRKHSAVLLRAGDRKGVRLGVTLSCRASPAGG